MQQFKHKCALLYEYDDMAVSISSSVNRVRASSSTWTQTGQWRRRVGGGGHRTAHLQHSAVQLAQLDAGVAGGGVPCGRTQDPGAGVQVPLNVTVHVQDLGRPVWTAGQRRSKGGGGGGGRCLLVTH